MFDDDGDSIYGGEGSGVAEDPDSGISTSTPLPVKRTGEVSMLVQSTITKASPVIANPSSKHANMDHPRTCMMLDTDPGSDAPLAQKWYKWATPGPHQASHEATPDDGSAKVIVSKMNDVMCELASSPSPVLAACSKRIYELGKCDSVGGWNDVELTVRCPMQRLSYVTDDRRLGNQGDELVFFVDENQELKCGRNTWDRASSTYCLMNTQFKFQFNGGERPMAITFGFDATFQPIVETSDGNKVYVPQAGPFVKLMDFSQYTETELTRARPSGFVPLTDRLVLLLCRISCCDRSTYIGLGIDDWKRVTLLTYIGPVFKYDPEKKKWLTYTQLKGWAIDETDMNAKTMLQAAATSIQTRARELVNRPDFTAVYHASQSIFTAVNGVNDTKASDPLAIKTSVNRLQMLPTTDRSMVSFVLTMINWTKEPGIISSFEDCKHIGYNNGIQMTTPPYAFVQRTSQYRISVEMGCDLLPAPEKNSPEWEELQRKVFEIPLKTFLDWDVVAREVDKFAVLLSSSCVQPAPVLWWGSVV